MIRWRRESMLDIYNLALAAILLVAPWLFSFAAAAPRANDWATGALVVALSAAALLAYAEWEEWMSLALGLWVMASPWLLGFQHAKAMPFNVAIGLLIAYFSALELWLVHYDPNPYDGTGPAVT